MRPTLSSCLGTFRGFSRHGRFRVFPRLIAVRICLVGAAVVPREFSACRLVAVRRRRNRDWMAAGARHRDDHLAHARPSGPLFLSGIGACPTALPTAHSGRQHSTSARGRLTVLQRITLTRDHPRPVLRLAVGRFTLSLDDLVDRHLSPALRRRLLAECGVFERASRLTSEVNALATLFSRVVFRADVARLLADGARRIAGELSLKQGSPRRHREFGGPSPCVLRVSVWNATITLVGDREFLLPYISGQHGVAPSGLRG